MAREEALAIRGVEVFHHVFVVSPVAGGAGVVRDESTVVPPDGEATPYSEPVRSRPNEQLTIAPPARLAPLCFLAQHFYARSNIHTQLP